MDNKQMAIMGLALSLVLPPIGLIVSAIALNKLKQSGQDEGKGFGIAGIVIGGLATASVIIAISCVACSVCASIAGMRN